MDRWLLPLALCCALAPASAAAESPCANQTCSGHGSCLAEEERAYCFCHDGYAAEGLSCVAAAGAVATTQGQGPLVATGDSIVRIARSEVGRDLPSVGHERQRYPLGLGNYIPSDALWCSDFVSWVYRVAGTPLTGGYEGGWLVTNNNAMRGWYERSRRWVPASSPRFQTFEPQPGDYVRIETATWGHSALVERVEGTTLHIIEGNAQGRVRANRYPNFRRHPKVGGFGIMTRASARRIWRPLLPSHWMPLLSRR